MLTQQLRFWLQEVYHPSHRGTLHQRHSLANPCLSPSTMWSARSPTIGLARRAPARHTRWGVTYCILRLLLECNKKKKVLILTDDVLSSTCPLVHFIGVGAGFNLFVSTYWVCKCWPLNRWPLKLNQFYWTRLKGFCLLS